MTTAITTTHCILCNRLPDVNGMWFLTASIARKIGRRAIPYAACKRCVQRRGFGRRVEDRIISMSDPERN